jgi:putative oxidoreductase
MKNVFAPFKPYAFAIFRVVFGLLFLQHGTQKLFGWPGSFERTLTPLVRVAACIEVVCGFLIMVGLMTELAAFLACGEMAFAYFLAHFRVAFWPIVNEGELPVLYCFAFLFLAAHGAGLWSLDRLWRRPGFG